ncbi:MAG: GtrA family protein [Eubacterium sp.]|nr:GtrA family protein [Eubacterium sp.]
MEKIKALIVKYKEVISYLFFGVVTTLVNWVVYAVMVRLLHVDLSAVESSDNVVFSLFSGNSGKALTLLFVANLVAWIASVLVAYVTNKLWVFESKSWKAGTVLRELWEFVAARLFTGLFEWFGIPALVMLGLRQSLLGIEGFWAKALVSVLVVVLNYIFSKFIIFKNKHKQENDAEAEEES